MEAIIATVAATGTTAATAGTAATVATTGFSLANALTIGSSVVSGLAAIGQGFSQSASLETKANYEDFNSRQQLLQGQQDAIQQIEQLNSDLSSMTVAGFASGLRPGGSVATVKKAAIDDVEYNIKTTRSNAKIKSKITQGNADSLRQDATSARTGSLFEAAGKLTEGALKVTRRGPTKK